MTAASTPDPTAAGCVAALGQAGLEIDASALARSLYASDASIYRIPPQVVTYPRDADDVLAALAIAREFEGSVTMRGAGTSIAGNAIGPGIVVDTTRHLNKLLRIDPEARTATVQPGIVHAALQRFAAPHGLRFGPDPSTHTRCTLGGMIGNNACGSRALGYGRTADNVVSLKVALSDGEVVGPRGALHQPGFSVEEERGLRGFPVAEPRSTSRLLSDVTALVDANLGLIRTEFGRFGRQVSGYSLEHLLPENDRNFDRFLVGSEGTLGVVLEATVRLVPDAPYRALALLGFPSMAAAADAVPAVLDAGAEIDGELTACEGLDHRISDLVPNAPELPDGRGWLFVEVTGDTLGQVEAAAALVAAKVGAPSRVVTDVAEQAALWRIREDGAGLAARTLSRPAHAGWEDAAVPPARLGDYLRDFETLLDDHGLSTVPYGHFGDGCVHARIDFELEKDDGRVVFRRFTEAAADLVASYGGSMSGEHGDGRARSELLDRMYSAEAVGLMAAVKHALDPANLLNPGVLVDPDPFDARLRLASAPAGPLADLFGDAHRCTGVGKCIADNTAGGGVMCPSYQASREEKDSTRGRSRVLQDVVTGQLPLHDPAVADALDLCLSCKGCAHDCPTGVDMATYKSQVLHAQYAGKRRPRSHYALGRLPRWASLAPASLANLSLRSKTIARLAKKVAGIDQRRGLPTFSSKTLRSFAQPARVRPAGTPDVWIWADSFTDHFASETGQAALELFAAAGIEAKVIPERACCALTWVTTGQLDQARKIISGSIRTLYPYVASGVPVIGLEPSCLASLRSDAAELLEGLPEGERAVEVAGAMRTLAEYLGDLRAQGRWQVPDLTGTEVVVQPHCHHASVLGFDADLDLLQASGATVKRLGGCCGLAGNFGVEQGHYETSVAIAEQTLLPAVRAAGPDAVILADGMSCRIQLADLAEVRGLHLAELLNSSR
ncbi:FAD-binding oxidoreductase [Nocardioides marmoriginsengisoli]|uniref:FAD-binding oxidoreductase n=1 Tax=Nocardioides marmoriginsengisoli TaxID=661483 RepID=A0A3N0CD29_9ACTN|nr:FAD-binding and (Fe-S)-binding domain-containing protein [Nocardioides marmoriginsengisoli]RNL61141.1 FAD-binding oxidoreductase [Nocardioides marmoriginsengisoli]